MNKSYCASRHDFRGMERSTGVANKRRISRAWASPSGIGLVPNSTPRTLVLLFHGEYPRARFSSHRTIQGNILESKQYPASSWCRRLWTATKAFLSPESASSAATKPVPSRTNGCERLTDPPSRDGAYGHLYSTSLARSSRPSYPAGQVTPRVPDTNRVASPFAKNGSPKAACCTH